MMRDSTACGKTFIHKLAHKIPHKKREHGREARGYPGNYYDDGER